MKHTQYENLVLNNSEDLQNHVNYTAQAIKERVAVSTVGYNTASSTSTSYYGIVKEGSSALQFSGVEDTEYTDETFTVQTGNAITRFNEDTNLANNSQYDGGEKIRLSLAQNINIRHKTGGDTANYIFLTYVELKKNRKYDESGINVYFVDRQDSWVVSQLTQAEATTLGLFDSNPNGYVDVTNVQASHLDALLNNNEKTYTFGSWAYDSGIFTIGSVRVTHYNSVFLGKVNVTSTSPVKYKFYHTLQGADALYGIFSRPKFSVVDNTHRNRKGSGTESDTNPHAQSLTDLGGFDTIDKDHSSLQHSSGIMPKFTTSLQCVGNATTSPDSVTVEQIATGEYLWLQGKRVTSISTTSVSFSDLPTTGTYYIYVMASGSAQSSPTYPYVYYIGTLNRGTTVPSAGFVLCSVYWDSSTQSVKAFESDPRYNASSNSNPVTDLRVFGISGYDVLHSTMFEHSQGLNLVPNGNMEIVEEDVVKGWYVGTLGDIRANTGSSCLKVDATTDYGLLFPFDAVGQKYLFKAKVRTNGTCNYQIKLMFYRGKDRSKDALGYYYPYLISENTSYSDWTEKTTECILDSDTQDVDVHWTVAEAGMRYRKYIGWACIEITVASGTLYIDDIILKKLVEESDIYNSGSSGQVYLSDGSGKGSWASLAVGTNVSVNDLAIGTTKIADLAITTGKIAANAVTLAKLNMSLGNWSGTYSVVNIFQPMGSYYAHTPHFVFTNVSGSVLTGWGSEPGYEGTTVIYITGGGTADFTGAWYYHS